MGETKRGPSAIRLNARRPPLFRSVPPRMVGVPTRFLNGPRRQRRGDVLAQSVDHGHHTGRHGRAPSSNSLVSSLTQEVARSPSHVQELTKRLRIRSYALTLWHSPPSPFLGPNFFLPDEPVTESHDPETVGDSQALRYSRTI